METGQNVKQLIDKVIADTPNNGFDSHSTQDRGLPQFDKRECKNKLSMLVLKDLICAMMRNEPIEGLDNMIGQSLGKYLNDPAFKNVDAYDYICQSRDRLSSPLLGELIQELDSVTDELAIKAKDGEKIDLDNIKVDDIINKVKDIDDLKKVIKEIASQKVIRDVTKNILDSDHAPTFGNLDEKLAKVSNEALQDSVIMTISSKIFKEAYREDKNADPDVATQKALVEFCVYQLGRLFKQTPRVDIFTEYDIEPSENFLYQEGRIFSPWIKEFAEQLTRIRSKDEFKEWFQRFNIERNKPKNLATSGSDIVNKVFNDAKMQVHGQKEHWLNKINVRDFVGGGWKTATVLN